MLTPTHAVTATTFFIALGGNSIAAAGVAVVASIAPDIDSRVSHIGRVLPFVSEPIEFHFGHRTVTHSLLAQVVFCSLAYTLLSHQFALAITVGLISHTVCDMMTARGVCWFWPSIVRCVIPGSPRYRFEVGGWGEFAFAVVMALCGFLAVSVHQQTAGATGVLRAALGDITAARRDYDETKGSHAFTLRVRGRDNATFAQIDGEYPVRAGWGSGGFLIDTDAGVQTVCTTATCGWYAEHAVLVAGQSQTTTTQQIESTVSSATALRESLAVLQSAGNVYVSGTLRGRLQDNAVTVQHKGNNTTLYYARPNAIVGDARLRDLQLTVQVRHDAAIVVPSVKALGSIKTGSTISLKLQKWLE